MGCCFGAGDSKSDHVPTTSQSVINSQSTVDMKQSNSNIKQFRNLQEKNYQTTNSNTATATKKKVQFEKKTNNNDDNNDNNDDDKQSQSKSDTYTPVDELDDADADPQMDDIKSQKQTALAEKQSQIAQSAAHLKNVKDDAFDTAVLRQQSSNYKGLHSIFQAHSVNDKMDIDGLAEALKTFGMVIDTDRVFKKHIWEKFDLDNAGEIDYGDFAATMSSLIGSKDETALALMFEIFDIKQIGYLDVDDMARILLAQNHITLITTGHGSANKKKVVYTKSQCLKQARRMIEKHDSDHFNDSKISFDEFLTMMMTRKEDDMLIQHMAYVSTSMVLDDVVDYDIVTISPDIADDNTVLPIQNNV